MADTPGTAEAAEAKASAPVDKGDPKKEDAVAPQEPPFKFELVKGDTFTLDHLLVNGSLTATIKISSQLTVTFKTLSVEQLQLVEKAVDLSKQRDLTAKYVMNEMTIAQIYHSLQALNGKAIPNVPEKLTDPDTDPRRGFIRKLPGVLFDQIVQGLNEFERHAKALVSGESLKNF